MNGQTSATCQTSRSAAAVALGGSVCVCVWGGGVWGGRWLRLLSISIR